MKIPTRNSPAPKKPTDDEFVSRQLVRTDAEAMLVTPKEDEKILEAMALSPVAKNEVTRPTENNQCGMLVLSEQEQTALMAPFPDSDFVRGAGGDQNLIYCEYSALKNRLSSSIGIGQWSAKVLGHWKESIEMGNPPKPATRVYVEVELHIRGYKVGHGIGDMVYYPSNAKMSYSDAFEGAKTNAFRRATKDFGLCSQVYSKEWCEAWKVKYKGFDRPEKSK